MLQDLDRVDRIVRQRHLPFVLLIFPFTFQLSDPSTRGPQQILEAFAAEHGFPVIDFTRIFAGLVYGDTELVDFMRARGYTLRKSSTSSSGASASTSSTPTT